MACRYHIGATENSTGVLPQKGDFLHVVGDSWLIKNAAGERGRAGESLLIRDVRLGRG
jgi:hypothetical protein